MRYALGLAVVCFMLPMRPAMAQSIVGTWALISLSEDHNGTITKPLGEKPLGQVIYGANQELATILVSGDREKQPGNPLTPVGPGIAYYGSYAVSENNISYHITASTYPNFAGTDQKGTFTLTSDHLSLKRQVVGGTEPFISMLEFMRVK